jgi:hypothetical protein
VAQVKAAQVLLDDVHFKLVVQVAVPHLHGYGLLTAEPSVTLQSAATQVLPDDVHF